MNHYVNFKSLEVEFLLGSKINMDMRNFNLFRSQIRKGKDWFEPILIRQTPLSLTPYPIILFALLNTAAKKNYSWVEKYLLPSPSPAPSYAYACQL
jgi:hypothetical protein